jgi:chromosome transmission fidelity protein 8
MIISINIRSPSTHPSLPPTLARIGHRDVVLIELQGSLHVECNHDSERNGQIVGKLRMDDGGVSHHRVLVPAISSSFGQNKPTLMIGHHLLEGKVATLPKPYAVLWRSASPSEDESMEESATPSWDVVAIVKRKIIFSKRPMPVGGGQKV